MNKASNVSAGALFVITIIVYLIDPIVGPFVFLLGFILLMMEQNNNHNYLVSEISQLKEKIEMLEQIKDTD